MTSPRAAGDPRGLLALLAGAVCIGFAPIWVRWSEVGSIATAFHRLALALPFLALWAAREPRPVRHPAEHPRTLRLWAAAGGAFFALDLAAWHLSIRWTSVANATLLGNAAPVFVTLGAWALFRERVPRRFFAGLLLALAGAWLLTGARPGTDPTRLRGDLLGLVTGAFYGGYQLCVARLRRDLPPGRVLWSTSLVCAPLLGLLALANGEVILPATGRGWAILVALTITAQLLGQGLITYGFAHLPARVSSLTLLLQPLVAVVAGWALLGENIRPLQALGAAILLPALFLSQRQPAPLRSDGGS